MKKFKKVGDKIEETDTSKAPRTIHDIAALKEQREFLLDELRKVEEPLKAVNEI